MTPSSSSATGAPPGDPDMANHPHGVYATPAASDDVIGSLGDALQGVNLGGSYLNTYPKDGNSLSWGRNPTLHGQQPNAQHGGFGGAKRVPSRSNLLFGTDMNDLSEPTTPVRKKSLELFLSQSPSQTLGEEVLKLQALNSGVQPGQNPALVGFPIDETSRAPGTAMSGATTNDLRQSQEDSIRRKNESPSCSVTGTSASSRSVSPSIFPGAGIESENRRTIQAFPGHEQGYGLVETRQNFASPQYPIGQIPHEAPHMRTIPGMTEAPKMQHGGNQYHQVMDKQFQQAQVATAPPQVLYMAVPTPDGRGQMLQPIQMVQLPGHPSAFVLPPSGAMPHSTHAGDGQQMMILPTHLNHASPPVLTGGVENTTLNKEHDWQVSPQYQRNGVVDGQYNDGHVVGRTDDFHGSPRHVNSVGTQRSSPTSMSGNGADAIASLYAAPQRPPLDALLGHVRRLSRDQVGCRLLQQALDEEGPGAATMILDEGISFWGEAMVDPFGNYLFQKILEKITADERIMLIKSVSSRLVNASLNLHGTRSVQKVVELCAVDEASSERKADTDGTAADILTRALTPAAARLCIDSHGNHVIQRILLKLGHRHSQFVFDAVAASVGDVARHRHGCCVIQRCLDSPPSDARSHLVRRIVEKCLELMQDAYGNYVVQYVLDVCGDEDVQAVCDSVIGKVCLLAIQKFSSNVMEKCLERCTDRVKELYLQELSDPERIRELMMDPFGNYVVQRALSVATHAQAIRLVEAMRPHLISSQPGNPHGQRNGGMRNTAGGRRIMAKICRRFPNFTLTAIGSPEDLYSQHKGHHRKHPQGNPSYSSAMSPRHQPAPYETSPHHARRPQGNMRQPYFDSRGTGYFDHMQNSHPSYPQM